MINGQCTVTGAALRGLEALPVSVEVMVNEGLPGFHIMGMPDASVLEARCRVKAAIRSAGFTMPNETIVVNLAPSSLKKAGTGFDLPIALGILAATGQIAPQAVEGRLFAGELALDGRVLPVRGTVAYASTARNLGYAFVGSSNCADIIEIEGVEQLGLTDLADMRSGNLKALLPKLDDLPSRPLDFIEVAGQEVAKRGLQIAAAGGHGVLIVGVPGSGKTMLAARVPSILPPLSGDEQFQAALIRSVGGEPLGEIMEGKRPLRMPHFTVTLAGMIGGGRPIYPGEVSLAHGGVLALYDVGEFNPTALKLAGSAVEQGDVCLARTDGNATLPTKPQVFVATANPCPCGHYGGEGVCTCSPAQIREYQRRIHNLIGGAVDICIDVRPVKPSEFLGAGEGTSSADLREGVMRARAFAAHRIERAGQLTDLSDMVALANLDGEARVVLEDVVQKAQMSGSDIAKVLKVARTIADMAESEKVSREHIAEALAFRPRSL